MENENGKLPFEATQNVYREAYEALVVPHLNNPESTIARTLKADEEVVLSGYKNTGLSPVENYAVRLPRNQLLPLALPLDRKVIYSRGLKHNLLQIYLFGEGKSLSSVGKQVGRVKQGVFQYKDTHLKNIRQFAERRNSLHNKAVS